MVKGSGFCSKEHQDICKAAAKYFNAEETIIRGSSNIRGKYFPDLTTKDSDIECELLKNDYIKNKINKWDKKRKKIIILGFPKYALDNFDEFYIYDLNGNIIKL